MGFLDFIFGKPKKKKKKVYYKYTNFGDLREPPKKYKAQKKWLELRRAYRKNPNKDYYTL